MAETCPHLAYREEGDGRSFETARAFCTVTESFVQPMRADVCNARYELDPARDCEFYVEPDAEPGSDASTDDGSEAPDADR
jgi:hypothetical protein